MFMNSWDGAYSSCGAASALTASDTGRYRSTDRKSTRLNSSHSQISYAVFCLKKNIDRVLFFIRRNFKAVAADNHRAFVSMKHHVAHARLRNAADGLAKLADGLEARAFDNQVL